jgi:hypothetical protein
VQGVTHRRVVKVMVLGGHRERGREGERERGREGEMRTERGRRSAEAIRIS